MKTFTFSLVLRTRENTDVFITLDENIFGIHSKRVNILYIWFRKLQYGNSLTMVTENTENLLCKLQKWGKNTVFTLISALCA